MNDNTAIDGIATSTVKWGGASLAVTGAFTLNEWLGILGLLVAIIGTFANFGINWYYKRQENNRSQERHNAIKEGWPQ